MSVKDTIESKLTREFSPDYLLVENESHMHNVPAGSEKHFKVQIVANDFADQMLIKRHRAINQVLKEELETSVHALSIHAFTPSEWQQRGGQVAESPQCQGGGKK